MACSRDKPHYKDAIHDFVFEYISANYLNWTTMVNIWTVTKADFRRFRGDKYMGSTFPQQFFQLKKV